MSTIAYNIKKYKYPILIFLFLILGSILRIYNITKPSFWLDEGHTINAIKGIYEYGIPQMISGELYTKHWLYFYNTYISTLFLGQNELGFRFISLLFGVLTILLSYLFAKKFFNNKKIALITTFLVTFSQFQVAWSRQARSYTMLQFFYLLSAYFLYKLTQKFNKKDFLYLISSSILCSLSHPIGAIIFPVSIFILTISYWQEIKSFDWKNRLKKKSYLLLIVLTICTFLLIIPKIKIFSQLLFSRSSDVSIKYLELLFKYFSVIFITSVPTLLYLIYKKENKGFFLVFIFLLPLIVAIYITDLVQLRYLFFIFPFFYLLFSYLITHLTKSIKNNNLHLITAILLAIILNIGNLQFIPKTNYSVGPLTPQPDFKTAYTEIKKDMKEGQIIISPYTVLTQAYLNEPGYWLKISMTGKQNGLEMYKNKKREFYTNSSIIHNFDQLKKLASQSSGYIVIDKMYLNRKNNLYKFKQEFKSKFHSGKGLNEIWVFKF